MPALGMPFLHSLTNLQTLRIQDRYIEVPMDNPAVSLLPLQHMSSLRELHLGIGQFDLSPLDQLSCLKRAAWISWPDGAQMEHTPVAGRAAVAEQRMQAAVGEVLGVVFE